MQTVLQALAALESLYQHYGPEFEPLLISSLEALKVRYPQPWAVQMINIAEQAIKASLPATP